MTLIEIYAIGEATNRSSGFKDFDAWKKAVINANPFKKLKFKGRVEGDKNTISAEVPGEDRSYGVWDSDDEEGFLLGEALKSVSQFSR